jgi:hypothetical protein
MKDDMDVSNINSDASSDVSIQDSSKLSGEAVLYEILFYDSDVDDDEEETAEFLEFIVSAAALEEEERASFHVRDCLVWKEHVSDLFKEGPLAFWTVGYLTYTFFGHFFDQ